MSVGGVARNETVGFRGKLGILKLFERVIEVGIPATYTCVGEEPVALD